MPGGEIDTEVEAERELRDDTGSTELSTLVIVRDFLRALSGAAALPFPPLPRFVPRAGERCCVRDNDDAAADCDVGTCMCMCMGGG